MISGIFRIFKGYWKVGVCLGCMLQKKGGNSNWGSRVGLLGVGICGSMQGVLSPADLYFRTCVHSKGIRVSTRCNLSHKL